MMVKSEYLDVGDVRFSVREFKITDEMTIRQWTPIKGNPSKADLADQMRMWLKLNKDNIINGVNGDFDITLPLVVFKNTFYDDPYWMTNEIIKAKKVGRFLLNSRLDNLSGNFSLSLSDILSRS